ncbi:hypothetical protein DFJ74DRAFT_774786 [Hyaloraphidium curvatum]|nr:hypothetical protein DFJ74DRAFT_774786 [Hyaloraphidium curvatum]
MRARPAFLLGALFLATAAAATPQPDSWSAVSSDGGLPPRPFVDGDGRPRYTNSYPGSPLGDAGALFAADGIAIGTRRLIISQGYQQLANNGWYGTSSDWSIWDYGIIELWTPIGDWTGYLGFGYGTSYSGVMHTAGYPAAPPFGQPASSLFRASCSESFNASAPFFHTSCDITGGHSGSAFYVFANNQYIIIGIIAFENVGGQYNGGTTLTKGVWDFIHQNYPDPGSFIPDVCPIFNGGCSPTATCSMVGGRVNCTCGPNEVGDPWGSDGLGCIRLPPPPPHRTTTKHRGVTFAVRSTTRTATSTARTTTLTTALEARTTAPMATSTSPPAPPPTGFSHHLSCGSGRTCCGTPFRTATTTIGGCEAACSGNQRCYTVNYDPRTSACRLYGAECARLGGFVAAPGTFLGASSMDRCPTRNSCAPRKADVRIRVANASARRGAKVALRATLTRMDTGRAVAGVQVVFRVGSRDAGRARTNAQGVAAFAYAVPRTLARGRQTVTVRFAGNAGLNARSVTGTLTVTG